MEKEIIKVGSHEVREIEWKGQRVITTAQLADVYETSIDNVRVNFNNNKTRFAEGKHYYLLEGEELRGFKNDVNDIYVVKPNASQLYLWTHRGASRHCKILDTEKAWEQFDNLEETYFAPKKISQTTVTYQYPLPAATFEAAANLGRLIERVMKAENSCPHEIAIVLRTVIQQSGIEVPDIFVKVPAYAQLSLNFSDEIVTR